MPLLPIYVISDLHTEFYRDVCSLAPVKRLLFEQALFGDAVLVIAGDLGQVSNTELYRQTLWQLKMRFKYTVLVPGNHEYYDGMSLDATDRMLREICDDESVILLQRNIWTHPSGVRFVGATLWSDVTAGAFRQLNDGRKIKEFGSNEYHSQFVRDAQFIRNELNAAAPTVVVTHHLPTHTAIHPKYGKGPLNTGFASNLDDLFRAPLKLWIHGHSHARYPTEVNGIPIVSNPLGYPHEVDANTMLQSPVFVAY